MKKRLHILLVEDNPGDADLTKDTWAQSSPELDVSVAVDGASAVEYLLKKGPHAEAKTPDIIVLDLNLPKMDGRQVLAEIKKHSEVCDIPVVVLTSSDAERDIAESYGLGASSYVTKPVDLTAFQAAVRSIEEFWFRVAKLP